MVRRSRPNKNRARGIANTRRGIFKKANTGHKYYGYEVAAVIRANGRVSTYESRPGILLDQTTWNVHYTCGPDDFKLEGWTDNPHETTDSATDQSSTERSTTSISDMPSSLDDLLALDFTSTPSVHSSFTAKSSPLSTSPVLAGQSFAPETPMPFLLGEPESNPPESRPGPSENYIYPSSLIRRDSEQDKRPAAAIYGFKSPQKTSARSPVLISSVKRQSLLALAHDIFGDVLD
ncbi:hypothetical protein PG993_008633 [Apiospora rasikravindrae]|uniref:MADS-box domain-containing protein n=1 Tax=Apiospora rasikravindrae TaxID=990691 RepID=A0ABR1SSD7_9PEZI